jgi:glyoxylase-like metal-dependent hydrolase (beta-lactamase superfamily II)
MRLADGLHRIGSDIVNNYLVADRDGVTIIDAGLPGHWKRLQAELSAMNLALLDVNALVLTHGDTDHIGFARRLHRETGVAAHVHQADVERARRHEKKPNSGWGPVKIRPLMGFLWYGARNGGLRIPPVSEVRTVADGEVLDVPGAPRIIHTPGHTPGSVAIHVPTVDALFVGDTMTTRNVLTGARGPRPAPFTLDPDQAIESLKRIEAIDATWVLPGHGPAWDGGVPEAVRLIREAANSANA